MRLAATEATVMGNYIVAGRNNQNLAYEPSLLLNLAAYLIEVA